MAQHEIVFDIETIGDIRDISTMKITVVSIYEYETDAFTSFEEHELAHLWPRFEKAARIIGYNSEHFDLPILNKYYAGDLSRIPHLDMLKVLKDATGKRYKLDDMAKATLQMEKSGHGLQAVEWWQQGEKQKVKEYCEQDVRVTKELYEYGLKNKMLYYATLTGELMPVAVNFEILQNAPGQQVQAQAGINMTLPF